VIPVGDVLRTWERRMLVMLVTFIAVVRGGDGNVAMELKGVT
jgi:hypothetical protein